MLTKTISLALQGIDAVIAEVEVDIIKGLPAFSIVGLPDSTIKESKDRIRSAIENSGYDFPPNNFIVNLAPAGLKKQGANFDLAIAMAILHATRQIILDPGEIPLIGELSLDGRVKAVKGVISMTIALYKAGFPKVIVPFDNRYEAAAVEEVEVYSVKNINEAIQVYEGKGSICKVDESQSVCHDRIFDFKDVCGQETVKRAMEIAAAGQHNILLYGPPGAGKTLIARCVPSILPDLSREKSIEATMIHSAGGLLLPGAGLIKQVSFRTPHHTSSDVALIGGGKVPSVGEISLAHNGVLFLDEFIEFKNNALQALRQPLEDHKVTVARASGTAEFPADFMLIAATNPCQCGYLFDSEISCKCSPQKVKNYFNKIAGPILDRIDMEVYVPRLPYQKLLKDFQGESSAVIKARVLKARAMQKKRFQGGKTNYNSRMKNNEIKQFCKISTEMELLFEKAAVKMNLSARSFFRILKVSRTIADIEESRDIKREHLLEALAYKNLQKHYQV